MQSLKKLLADKKERMELIRYVAAGFTTTVLSLIISYGMYMLLSKDHTINGATSEQVMIGNTVSWIVCVVFAFWINRRMVFRVQDSSRRDTLKEFAAFAGARVVSWALFEVGVTALLKTTGILNDLNRLMVLVLVMVFNYVASKFWIFKPKTDGKDAPTPPEG